MKARFSSSVRRNVKKTDNAHGSMGDKVAIRREVMQSVSAPCVFDAFAGSGVLYRSVWRDAVSYVGCDLRYFRDDRTAYVADNRRVMRAVDLRQFNVFDLDSYGSPWEQVLILITRRQVVMGERIGLVLTEGSRMKATFGQLPTLLADFAGLSGRVPGAHMDMHGIVDRAIVGMCRRWGVRIVKQWRAESHAMGSARPIYIGLVLEGVSDAAAPEAGSDTLQEGMVAGLA